MKNWIRRGIFCLAAVAVVVFVALLLRGPASESPAPERRPNIIVIVIESLRADHCGCYGQKRATTPTLDGVAREGVTFSQCYASSSWTTPSVGSLMTGLSPIHHGLTSVTGKLPDGISTLSQELKRSGYYTLGVLCNSCADGKMGFDRGFDVYDDFTILADLDLDLFAAGGGAGRKEIHNVSVDRQTTDLALRHLRKAPQDRPYFLFVFYFDPHFNYIPSGGYATMFDPDYRGKADGNVFGLPDRYTYPDPRDLEHVRALYDGEVRQTDDEIARLLGAMREKGRLSDKDLLVITSDHGEEFCDHGGLKHGFTLYEEVVRVPLVMRWPGRLPAGKKVSALVEHRDLPGTLVAAAGGKAPEGMSRLDLVRLARGDAAGGHDFVGMHTSLQDTVVGIRTSRWSVLVNTTNRKGEAFDLQADPRQARPLDPAKEAEPKRLLGLLEKWVGDEARLGEKLAGAQAGKGEKLSEEHIQLLKALGYMR